jgi:hypothetical protein
MPSEERKACALEAVHSRIEQFHAALTVTSDQVRGLLAGSGNTADDQSEALGFFAKGKLNMERFASFTPKTTRIEAEAEAPIRAAQEVLKSQARSNAGKVPLRHVEQFRACLGPRAGGRGVR